MSESVREPVQQRSIDKKNRIIEAGYALFAEKGYYNTNTVEIAKKAGVSTGIVYGYFHDKRDILYEVLDIYIDNVFSPVMTMFDKITALNFSAMLPHIVDATVETHRQNAAIHEALHSMSNSDKEINDKFLRLEEEITVRLANRLELLDYKKDDVNERVHLAMETVQSYAHECVFDRHSIINYTNMRTIVINMLVSLFEN